MEFDVLVTARAETDLQTLGDWLHERSADGARRWTIAASAALTGLRDNPRRHSFAPENDYSDREVRNALFKTRRGRVYRAIFYIESSTVVVTHMRASPASGGRRNLSRSTPVDTSGLPAVTPRAGVRYSKNRVQK